MFLVADFQRHTSASESEIEARRADAQKSISAKWYLIDADFAEWWAGVN